MERALEDLEDWHSEAGAFPERDGSIGYHPCMKCDTCEKTMPMLERAIELAYMIKV
jgi:hypothetical protein